MSSIGGIMKVIVKDVTELTYEVEVNDDSGNYVMDACAVVKYYAKDPTKRQHWQTFYIAPEAQ
jgi:hypothetical protein